MIIHNNLLIFTAICYFKFTDQKDCFQVRTAHVHMKHKSIHVPGVCSIVAQYFMLRLYFSLCNGTLFQSIELFYCIHKIKMRVAHFHWETNSARVNLSQANKSQERYLRKIFKHSHVHVLFQKCFNTSQCVLVCFSINTGTKAFTLSCQRIQLVHSLLSVKILWTLSVFQSWLLRSTRGASQETWQPM